jgi:hypothetical protein
MRWLLESAENKPGATFHSDAGTYFLWFARLYDSLCAKEPLEARRELLTWPAHEPFFSTNCAFGRG